MFLTVDGKLLAQQSRERHQIVELFLCALGISPETARIDAEGIEHHVSSETLDAFRAFCLKVGGPLQKAAARPRRYGNP